MKCPLHTIPGETYGDSREPSYCNCRKSDCEWYFPDFDSCAIWSIAHHLETLADVLTAIDIKYQGQPVG